MVLLWGMMAAPLGAYAGPIKVAILGAPEVEFPIKEASKIKMSELIDKIMEGLKADQRAKVDLVQFTFAEGPKAYVPRALFKKRVWTLDNTSGKPELIPPTRDSELTREGFWMDPFKRKIVTGIDLLESKTRFIHFFLIKRSDPVASRGERLYLQACITCHGSAEQWLTSQAGATAPATHHPDVNSSQAPFGAKELRSVQVYSKSWLSERKVD